MQQLWGQGCGPHSGWGVHVSTLCAVRCACMARLCASCTLPQLHLRLCVVHGRVKSQPPAVGGAPPRGPAGVVAGRGGAVRGRGGPPYYSRGGPGFGRGRGAFKKRDKPDEIDPLDPTGTGGKWSGTSLLCE
jgi:hypothetical protein